MDDNNPLDLPIEATSSTAPMQQDVVAEEYEPNAPVSMHWAGDGIEAGLVGLLVLAGLKAEVLAAQVGHLAEFESQSLARILFSLQASLSDLRATKAVLTAA